MKEDAPANFLADLAACEKYLVDLGKRPVLTTAIVSLVLSKVRRAPPAIPHGDVLDRVPVLEEADLCKVLPTDEALVPVLARTPYFLRYEGVRDVLPPGRLVGVAFCGGYGADAWYTGLSLRRWGGVYPEADELISFRTP